MGAEEPEKEKPTPQDPDRATLTEAEFLSWKRRKDAEASVRRAEAARTREENIRAGAVRMNGRELFLHEPWVFDDNSY